MSDNFKKLSETILKLKQNVTDYTFSSLLDSINLGRLKEIESLLQKDLSVSKKYTELVNISDKLAIDHSAGLETFFNKYSEIVTFIDLKKIIPYIQFVPESKNPGEKTPDFEFRESGESYYIELKTLLHVKPILSYPSIIEDGLNKKIETEEEIRRKQVEAENNKSEDPIVVTSMQTIAPYSNAKDYDLRSVRIVIESIIDKAYSNYKIDQFRLGNTFYLINLSQLIIPSQPELALLPYYYSYKANSVISGTLWQVAFGKLDSLILRTPDFRSSSNFDGYLSKQGLLHSTENIKGLIFQVGNQHKGSKFVGLHCFDEYKYSSILKKICKETNDDHNKNEFNIMDKYADKIKGYFA